MTQILKTAKSRFVERKRANLKQKRKEVAVLLVRNSKTIKALRSQQKELFKTFVNLKNKLKKLEAFEISDADEGEPSSLFFLIPSYIY